MAKYIDAEAVLKNIKELQETEPATIGKKQFADGYFVGLDEAEILIMQAPAADVAEVKHGRCKFCEDIDKMHEVVCYLPHDNGNATDIPINFCPNCGAKMKG